MNDPVPVFLDNENPATPNNGDKHLCLPRPPKKPVWLRADGSPKTVQLRDHLLFTAVGQDYCRFDSGVKGWVVIWEANCRYCGNPFQIKTFPSAIIYHEEFFEVFNCPEHKGRRDPKKSKSVEDLIKISTSNLSQKDRLISAEARKAYKTEKARNRIRNRLIELSKRKLAWSYAYKSANPTNWYTKEEIAELKKEYCVWLSQTAA